MISKHATEDFPWTANEDEEDLTCTKDEYILRVEQMDEKLWWWQVSFRGEAIYVKKAFCSSKYRAIGLAEGTYMGHYAIN